MTRLKKLIDSRDITQKQLANELGLSLQTLNNYVNEKREPDFSRVCQICDYFGCTADYFLGRSDSPAQVISNEDAQLLFVYHSLPIEIRRAVDGLIEPYRADAEEKNVG